MSKPNQMETAITPAFGMPVCGRRPFGITTGVVRGSHQADLAYTTQGTPVWRPPDC